MSAIKNQREQTVTQLVDAVKEMTTEQLNEFMPSVFEFISTKHLHILEDQVVNTIFKD